MATFQLPGLPSQQIENQTAGGLGLPTVPQYAERPNTGVMLAQGLGAISERLAANKQQQSEADFMNAFGQAYAANDRDAMKQLAAAHPEQIERIQKGMGFIDQDRNQMIGQAVMDLRLAAKRGDQSLMSSLQKNAPVLNQMGLSPEEAFLSYKQDPKQFDQITDLISMHALGPENYFDIQDKKEGRDIDRDKLAVTVRGQNISAQNATLDREIRKAELENKKLDRQAQNSTNELRRQTLAQQIAANQQKIDEANEKKRVAPINDRKRIDTINDNADRLAQQAQSILDNPYLEWTVGAGSIMPNIPGTVRADLAAQISNLKDQIGLQTLSSMKELSANGASGLGNTTNREFGSLQNSLGNLSEKQSPEALRKTLQNIIKNANSSKNRLNTHFKQIYPDFKQEESNENIHADSSNLTNKSQSSSDYSSLWGG